MRHLGKPFDQAGRFGLLWLSLLVNLYFLIFQPRSVFSLRRLAFSVVVALVFALLLWFLKERGITVAGWRGISTKSWWMGIILTAVLFLITPAPTLHSLVAPVEVRLNFEPLNSEEADFQLVWLNNGLGDLSFSDLELPPTARITSEGVSLNARQGQPVQIRWRGRIWDELLVTVRSEVPLRLIAQVGDRPREILMEGGSIEKGIHLPYLSFGFYAVCYLLVMMVGSLSLAWLSQVFLNEVERIYRRYPPLLEKLIQYLPFVSLVSVGLFYLLTLRSGHPWGDDFAQYIAHARNLTLGQPYTAIGILHNPAVVLGPSAYPPLFPLLLAPVYAVFGLNLTAFKVLVSLFTLLGLVVFNEWLKSRKITAPLRALALLLAGLHPWYWNYKDQILSDMPFVLLGLLALVLWEIWNSDNGMKVGWLLGLCLLASIAARTVGVILLIAILLDAVLYQRWRARTFLPVLAVPLAGVILLNLLLPGTGDYLEQARGWDWTVLQRNFSDMATFSLQIWRSSRLLVGGVSLIAVMGLGLLILGLASRLRHIGAAEFYLVGTVGMILIWPHPQGFRFYLPVFFLLVYSVLEGWRWLRLKVNHAGRGAFKPIGLAAVWLVLALLVAGILEGYLKDYQRLPLKEFENGIGLPESEQMFEYIRKETRPTDVIAFFKPRALALMTGRTAFAPYWDARQPQRLIEDLAAFQADYLVVWKPDYSDLAAFARQNSNHLILLFENDDFDVFSIRGAE